MILLGLNPRLNYYPLPVSILLSYRMISVLKKEVFADATRSEASSVEVFRNSEAQVAATGGVLHVAQDTLLAMKGKVC